MIPAAEQTRWPKLRGARLRQVIEVEFNHGAGEAEDPVRRVVAYFSEHGELLAWHDLLDNAHRRIDMGMAQ